MLHRYCGCRSLESWRPGYHSSSKIVSSKRVPLSAVAPPAAPAAPAAVAPLHSHRPHARRSLCAPLRSGWDESLTLSDLRHKLEAAVAAEDYAEAARIRDTLQHRQTDAKLAIEDANKRFYDAFRSGNLQEMDRVWGEGDQVQVMHPAAACIAGRPLVMESWASILRSVRPNAFTISLEDVRVFALSETTGLVTCVEVVETDESRGRTVATNVFEQQGGKWVIVLHQGGPLPSRRF